MDTTLRDPLIGALLDGRYRVESRIARGGMASVYVALDERLDRTVAVKVMHADLAADPEFVSRFIREAKSAARLSHPNVVSVFDQGSDGELTWIVMEYVEGRTLRDLMRERGPLAPRTALELLEPVLAALAAAHRAGIVHRDVKPENVLLADDGRIKVADFGLARAVTSATSHTTTQGLLIGTVSYLSPEQVERGVADPRSDVYSAGILLFELLTGTKPFDGDSPIQIAFAHVHEDVPPPSARQRGIAPQVDELVSRVTARDPDRRPPDASRMLADVVALRRALPAAPAAAPNDGSEDTMIVGERTRVVPRTGDPYAPSEPPAAAAHARPRRRRRRGLLALLLLIVIAAALGLGGWRLGAGPWSTTSTPSLLGLTQSAAAQKAADAGLRIDFTSAFSETVDKGRVIRTDPGPNAKIDKDGVVAAVVSRGKERYAVPTLTGRTEAQARSALTSAHLSAGPVTRTFSETVPEGRVLSSDPPAAASLKRGASVALVVSRGRQPIAVPSFVGKEVAAARAALEKAGLTVKVDKDFSTTVPKGSVIEQKPDSGTLFRGGEVRLVESQGPPLVSVPDVTDDRTDSARRELEKAGFRVVVRGSHILDRVVFQSPGAHRKAPLGSTITLTTI